MLYATPWQTVGPYLHIGMTWLAADDLAGDGVAGERIAIEGVLRDGNGAPVADGLIELWQADAQGRYDGVQPGFRGFGRVPTDADGRFRFRTVKPGRVPAGTALQAPHINVSVFARGILKRLVTRIYFDDDASNAEDPVLALVPAARRDTLLAKRQGAVYRFDILIQGDGETVFFEI